MKVKCKRCGSTDVEIRTWVNPNTLEVSSLEDIEYLISEHQNCWCKQCFDNTDLVVENIEP